MHPAHSLGKLLGWHVFQQVSGCSCIERPAQISGPSEGSENDDAHWNTATLQLGRNFQASERGHLNVGDEDVGPRLLHRAESFVTVARPRNDLDVIFHFEVIARARNGNEAVCTV